MWSFISLQHNGLFSVDLLLATPSCSRSIVQHIVLNFLIRSEGQNSERTGMTIPLIYLIYIMNYIMKVFLFPSVLLYKISLSVILLGFS